MTRLKIKIGDLVLVDQTGSARCDLEPLSDLAHQWRQSVAAEECLDGCDIKLFGRGNRGSVFAFQVIIDHGSPALALQRCLNFPDTLPKDPAVITIMMDPDVGATLTSTFAAGIVESADLRPRLSQSIERYTLRLAKTA